MQDKKIFQIGGLVASLAVVALLASRASQKTSVRHKDHTEDNVLIGDVGGTNVRFELIRLFHDDQEKRVVLKKLTKFNP